ncbi:MAG: hypothetical protein IH789_10730 [Acidobacteria bacterium]|nr:hypothetical protein [Acidobacteriota bacterium]MCH8948083.1 hypothetical protein [Acidobacteriota bacterium]
MSKRERVLRWRRRALLATTLAVALLSVASPVQVQEASFPELDAQLEPLRAQFNADAGKVRLILLLEPT